MSRKPESYWKMHINEWEKSGLSITAYAKHNGIIQSTLSKRIKRAKQGPKPIKVSLEELDRKSCSSEILIESKTVKIKLPSTVSSAIIQAILKEIR